MPSRNRNAEIARETLAIIEAGGYTSAGGGRVDLAEDIRRAIASTTLHRPEDFPANPLPPPGAPQAGSTIEVTGETTLQAAHRLAHTFGVEPMCPSFASARNPRRRVP
jgi:uncharacterized protein (TIGR02452 family)